MRQTARRLNTCVGNTGLSLAPQQDHSNHSPENSPRAYRRFALNNAKYKVASAFPDPLYVSKPRCFWSLAETTDGHEPEYPVIAHVILALFLGYFLRSARHANVLFAFVGYQPIQGWREAI